MFTYRVFLLVACISFFFNRSLLAVDGNFPEENCEQIYVHTDKTVYLTGEYMLYKAYVINDIKPTLAPESKILYFTLTNNKTGHSLGWRINLNGRTVHGAYHLPKDIQPGMYSLRVYTNRIKANIPEFTYIKDILLVDMSEINPDTLFVRTEDNRANDRGPDLKDNQLPDIRALLPKSVYETKETVVLSMLCSGLKTGDSANLSISVFREQPFEEFINEQSITEQFSKYSKTDRKKCEKGVENNGFILTGKAKNKINGHAIANANILLSFVDSISPQIKYALADENGNFRFYLNQYYDNRELILQVINLSENLDPYVELENRNVSYDGSAFRIKLMTVSQISRLNEIRSIGLVNEVYHEDDKKDIPLISPVSRNFFGDPDITIYPSDYVDMKNFKEIADNLLPSVRFNVRNNEYSLQVYDYLTDVWMRNSMLIMNGTPFTDLNYLATLGTHDIERIEIIGSPYLVGDLNFNGVVSVYTYDRTLPDMYLKRNTYVYSNHVLMTDEKTNKYQSDQSDNSVSMYPDFRENIYWNPELIIFGDSKTDIRFKTSELSGRFFILINGITSSGDPIGTKLSFEVK